MDMSLMSQKKARLALAETNSMCAANLAAKYSCLANRYALEQTESEF